MPAARDNTAIADAFDEIADLLETRDANPFRLRAYRNAARTIRRYAEPMADLVAAGADLTALPGIGEDLAGKIAQFVGKGHVDLLDQLRREVPHVVVELLKVPQVGPKRATRLWRDLGIRSIEQLHRAARDGRLAAAKGFGKAFEATVLEALEQRPRAPPGRMPLAMAVPVAEALRAYLAAAPTVGDVVVAGSYRRGRETVGDLDILVTATAARAVIDRFTAHRDVVKVLAAGDTRATAMLRSVLQVDIRVVVPEAYGSALQYFTGSKAHSIALRRIAQAKGLKLNEYGVWRGARRIAGDTEESVYAALGLPWILPELRENRGEIEAARERRLPDLVAEPDLKGDLHVHVSFADQSGIAALAAAAERRGYAYLALTARSDHLGSLARQDGAAVGRLVDRLPSAIGGVALLKAVEVGVTADGGLDLPDEVLARFDLVIAAVHADFDRSREAQTVRLSRALAHPLVSILSHPSRTRVPRAAPYDVDMGRLVRAAAERSVAVEITADPARLDVGDVDCRLAQQANVRVAVSSEAGDAAGLAAVRLALLQAVVDGWRRPTFSTRCRSARCGNGCDPAVGRRPAPVADLA